MTGAERFALGIAGFLLISLGQVIGASPTSANHCYEEERAHLSHGHLITTVEIICPPHDGLTDTPAGDAPPPAPAGSALCWAGAVILDVPVQELCGGPDADPPVVTDGMVASALRRLPLPPSELSIQPPDGRTLVNFDTNFFTENDDPLLRTVRLLGQAIELRIRPDSYTWRFGDGTSETTTSPGAKYPHLEVTHNYLSKGDYRPSVTTTYSAEWRVGPGPWGTVPGTAVIPGGTVDLSAIEARPTLVGYGG